MALFSTFWACSLISAYSFPRDSVSLPQRGSIYPTEGVLEALFTGVRGIVILGSSPFGHSPKLNFRFTEFSEVQLQVAERFSVRRVMSSSRSQPSPTKE